MSALTATIFDQAGDSLGGFLPRFAGAIALLIVGLLVARLFGGAVRKLLEALDVDDFARKWRIDTALGQAGIDSPLSDVIGRMVRAGISIVVVFAALSLLGLQFLSESLNAGVLLLPKIAVAAALVLAGVVLGGFVREWVDRISFQMGLPAPIGQAAQAVVIAIFVITAAAQVAVSTAFLLALVGILLAGAAAMAAIAFGLGGSDVAREMSAGRYLRTAYEPGQRLRFDSIEGTVVSVDTAVTVLRTDSGAQMHVPNTKVLGAVVTVDRPSEP